MDFRSEETLRRKREELRIAKEKVIEKSRKAEIRKKESQRKKRDEENSDAKADKAQAHSNLLRHDRAQALSNIRKYQRQIDQFASDMTYFEKRIDELLYMAKVQIGDMKAKKQEATNLREEATCLKREADLNCIPGLVEREFHGLNRNSKHKELLQKAEEKMQKAIDVDKIAQKLNQEAKKHGEDAVSLGEKMLINGKWRGDVEKIKIQEEQKAANLGEKLKTYKIEISNCEYLSRKLREEGAQHEEASYRLEEEAVNAEKLARQAEEEIRELEKELENKQIKK